MWAWGNNSSGILGDSTNIQRNSPIQIGTAINNWLDLSVGGSHVIAIKTDGSIWAWGRNDAGQLGNGVQFLDQTMPSQIGIASNWIGVAAGHAHSVATKADGTLWAWGNNSMGQIGDNTD